MKYEVLQKVTASHMVSHSIGERITSYWREHEPMSFHEQFTRFGTKLWSENVEQSAVCTPTARLKSFAVFKQHLKSYLFPVPLILDF